LFISITKNRWFRLSAWIAGNEILPEARVLAIADIVEAMASYRPYRPALGIEKALHEIELLAGKQLDAEYVAVCTRMFREENFALPLPDHL
jgi:HD-GYP domain-containing protein (c-di-GMP phosphodiesterase class II)